MSKIEEGPVFNPDEDPKNEEPNNEEFKNEKPKEVKRKKFLKIPKKMFMETKDTSSDHIFNARKPSLDYYDNRRDYGEGGGDVNYQGKYGRWEKD